MREKLEKLEARAAMAGITPACAGKTDVPENGTVQVQDHPRVCGKNILNCFDILFNLGSPPRVREKLLSKWYSLLVLGITPACAGKTKSASLGFSEHQDHPRVCGKNEVFKYHYLDCPGSPPRVREKLDFQNTIGIEGGITPACAGKTY